ncbi:MAG: amidohydrolase family protein, partial [Ilumatobacteraceae bacterium]
ATEIHTHSSEQQLEINAGVDQFGRRPIHKLEARGLLDGGRCVTAHCVWLDDAELDAPPHLRPLPVLDHEARVACRARVAPMWARGVTVGLGSDGNGNGNGDGDGDGINLDLLEEMNSGRSSRRSVPSTQPPATLADPRHGVGPSRALTDFPQPERFGG